MARGSLRAWMAVGLLLIAVIAAFVVALIGAQRESRNDLTDRFAERASLSAALTESVLSSSADSAKSEYPKLFGGARIDQAMLDAWKKRGNGTSVVVLEASGAVVGASAKTPPALLRDLSRRPDYIRRAFASGEFGLSDVLRFGAAAPVIQFAQPFDIPAGRRVLVSGFQPKLLYGFFGDYLSQVPNRGGKAYVLDTNGVVVGAPAGAAKPATQVAQPGLVAAMKRNADGRLGTSYYTSRPVRGSGWRVVLTAPEDVLFASVSGVSKWLPWGIVAAFVIAGISALIVLLRAMRNGEALRRSQERSELIIQGSNDGIWDRDLGSGELYLSPRWKEILGLPQNHPASDDAWKSRVHPEDIDMVTEAWRAWINGSVATSELEYRMLHGDTTYRWVLVRGMAVRDADGHVTRLAGSMADITARKVAEARLREDALHDALTGLANRTLFYDRLTVALEKTHRDAGRRCAVLFLDLDRFKLINDTFSHAVGDGLLVQLGQRLSMLLRPGDTVARGGPQDTVARLGGDEFTILLDDVQASDAPMRVAERILLHLEEPFQLGTRRVSVGASIGVAYSGPGSTPAEMMRNADLAMYQAKRDGKARVCQYNDAMHERVTERMNLEIALRGAIEDRRLRVFYQPIVALESGQLAGFEALARWPEGLDPVPPDQFIPVAEETGLIAPLGRLVLDAACDQLAAWRRDGIVAPDVTMSVNISAVQLGDPELLVGDVKAALERTGLPADLLRLELTESTMIAETERLHDTLGELKELGVRAHVDDFGTGYSSLRFLKDFPGDTLKIDRSFVSTMLQNAGHHEIVRAIATLSRDLGLQTIAEGIDDPAQVERLRALGCQFGQGFLFARPLPAAEIPALLNGWGAVIGDLFGATRRSAA